MKRNFRKDLFYRINVIKIELPPLRRRREDIPLMVDHFIEKYCSSMRKEKKVIHPKAVQVLMNHEWPGNVRELQNVIERIMALHTGKVILDQDIMENITVFQAEGEYDFLDFSYGKAKEIFEKRYMANLLKRFPKDLTSASRHAKIHPATIYRKIKHYELMK